MFYSSAFAGNYSRLVIAICLTCVCAGVPQSVSAQVSTKTQVEFFEWIEGLPECADTDKNKLLHTETDKKGNTFEIFCNGQYQGKFTKADGTVAWVGKCKYAQGHNYIRKKFLSTVTVTTTPDGRIVKPKLTPADPAYTNPDEIEIITWKNVEPVGEPPKEGKKGELKQAIDTTWTYDAKTNALTTQPTWHRGQWELEKDKDAKDPVNWFWTFAPDDDHADGKPSTQTPAPAKPELLSSIPLGHPSRETVVPPLHGEPVIYTPVPFTVVSEKEIRTYVSALRQGAHESEVSEIEATAGKRFRFHVDLPHASDDLITFELAASPAGMTIDSKNGTINWTPSREQIGYHLVIVQFAYYGLSMHADGFLLHVRPDGEQTTTPE
jgi:hypothetical protein